MYVVLFVFADVAGDMLSDFVWVSVICEVHMVGDDKDGVFRAFQEVVPMFKTTDDC